MKLPLNRTQLANRRGCLIIALILLIFGIGIAIVAISGEYKPQGNRISMAPTH